ncbi:RNA polymerase sigma factor [Sunxiuqinia indica]|uniref:RNA polymerase sigma factor n=1 Tax=Sunxiuqinia indica TaxID=2692584 RepID=UPI00135CD812|nr:RNA polymerase sigma-70 factor [Sunxiuqinia indica]
MDLQTDSAIFAQISQGDQKALELLYERYYHPLCNFAFSFLKSVDYTEEVVSDVFLAVWLKRDTLSIKSSIKSYLFAAVRNHSVNFLKTQKKYFEEIERYEFRNNYNEDADAHLTYAETLQQVEMIIDKLPPQRRAIFILNRMEGMKYKEIADLLAISVNTVQKQMTEAVKHVTQYSSASCVVLFSYFSQHK